MKLQQAYQSGFERKDFCAYGYKLHPITLGHMQMLAEMECRIATGEANKIDLTDIAKIVTVCVFPRWEQAREHLKENPGQAAKIAIEVAQSDKSESSTVVDFVIYYLAKPKNNLNLDPAEQRIPWWWNYAEFLQTEMGRSEVEAWGTICSDGFAYFASFATRAGSKTYMTQRELWFDEQFSSGKTIESLYAEGVL
jgi:hypothetical protein